MWQNVTGIKQSPPSARLRRRFDEDIQTVDAPAGWRQRRVSTTHWCTGLDSSG